MAHKLTVSVTFRRVNVIELVSAGADPGEVDRVASHPPGHQYVLHYINALAAQHSRLADNYDL